jgi:phage terminase large subunit GpA-like protein
MTEAAVKNLDARLAKARQVLRPPPTMTVPDWADRYRHLSTSSGAVGGPWQTSRVEVARGPMMAVTEPGVRRITVMTCTQLLKTSLLENIIGYFMHLDPCPILLTQPKDESVEAFSKERLVPMIKASPALREIASTRERSRQSDDTMRFKRFPGGFLAMASAGSPTNLAMRAIRITLLDEVDKYEPTKEGDPIILAEERTATFLTNSLSVRACSPTWEETSRIFRSYLEGDQRKPYVACPHCGHWQVLGFFSHVHWEKDAAGDHIPDSAAIYCEECGGEWTEADRVRAITTRGMIRHQQTRPLTCCDEHQEPMETRSWDWDEDHQVGYATCTKCGSRGVSHRHASFTASKLYSPFITVGGLVDKWFVAKDDPEQKQTFYNTQLGLPFRAEIAKEINHHWLASRREVFPAPVPAGAVVLTAGIDAQPGTVNNSGRLEIEVVCWGVCEESWSVDQHVIVGDPARPEIWAKLDEYLLKGWNHEHGFDLRVMAACIDSGGHNTQDVYSFARSRIGRNVWAIKGASDRGGTWQPVWPPLQREAKPTKYRTGFKPIMVGCNSAKESIRQRLLIEEPGPGYCHFPVERSDAWFEQLTSENLTIERRMGMNVRKWVLQRGRANEALDCRVYAYAALIGLYHTRRLNLVTQAALLEQLRGHGAPTPVHRRGNRGRSKFMER